MFLIKGLGGLQGFLRRIAVELKRLLLQTCDVQELFRLFDFPGTCCLNMVYGISPASGLGRMKIFRIIKEGGFTGLRINPVIPNSKSMV
jgi:hypothetical protein